MISVEQKRQIFRPWQDGYIGSLQCKFAGLDASSIQCFFPSGIQGDRMELASLIKEPSRVWVMNCSSDSATCTSRNYQLFSITGGPGIESQKR